MSSEEQFNKGKAFQDGELIKPEIREWNLVNIIKGQQFLLVAARGGSLLAKTRLSENSELGQRILDSYIKRFSETCTEEPLVTAKISDLKGREWDLKNKKINDISMLLIAGGLGNSDALKKIQTYYTTPAVVSIDVLNGIYLDLDELCGGRERTDAEGKYKHEILKALVDKRHKIQGVEKVALKDNEIFNEEWSICAHPTFTRHDFSYGISNPAESFKWLQFSAKCELRWAIEQIIQYYFEREDWQHFIEWKTATGVPLSDCQKTIGDHYRDSKTPAEILKALDWYKEADRPEAEINDIYRRVGDFYKSMPAVEDWIESLRYYKLAKRPEAELNATNSRIADYYFGRQMWKDCITFYAAANVPLPDTQKKIGDWYLGEHGPEYWVEALKWYKAAGRPQHELDAINKKIADFYFNLERWDDAIKYYSAGNVPLAESQKKIGDYCNSKSTVDYWIQAIQWYTDAKRPQVEIDAVNKKCSDYYFSVQDWDNTIKFASAASIPLADTQTRIGNYYRDRSEPLEVINAVKWYELAGRPQSEINGIYIKCAEWYFARQNWPETLKFYAQAGIAVEVTKKKIGDYYYNCTTPADILLAVKWYQESHRPDSEIDDVYRKVADIYNGKGTPEDWLEAIKYYHLAHSTQSQIDAVYKKIADYYNRRSTPQDWIEAIKYYEIIHDQTTIIELENRLGNWYYSKYSTSLIAKAETKKSLITDALKWHHMAADNGNYESEYKLGLCYKAINDFQKSEYYLCLSANHKLPEAIAFLLAYHPKTFQAVDWVKERADNGDAQAQFRMARNYAFGRVVEKNDDLAIEYYRKAYGGGHFKSGMYIMMFSMTSCFRSKSKGTKQSPSVAPDDPNFDPNAPSRLNSIVPGDSITSSYRDGNYGGGGEGSTSTNMMHDSSSASFAPRPQMSESTGPPLDSPQGESHVPMRHQLTELEPDDEPHGGEGMIHPLNNNEKDSYIYS